MWWYDSFCVWGTFTGNWNHTLHTMISKCIYVFTFYNICTYITPWYTLMFFLNQITISPKRSKRDMFVPTCYIFLLNLSFYICLIVCEMFRFIVQLIIMKYNVQRSAVFWNHWSLLIYVSLEFQTRLICNNQVYL